MTERPEHLPFPQMPRSPSDETLGAWATGSDLAALADELRREVAAITAERDRAVAEAKRLREQRDARGLYRLVGAIGEGLGVAVALSLTFGALAAVVAGIMWVFGWRP